MQPAVPYIRRFPDEIVTRILELIPHQDLIAVAIEWPEFTGMIKHIISPSLQNISVMFEERSLGRFSRILKFPGFAQEVRKLTVSICHFLPLDELDHVEIELDEEWGYKTPNGEHSDEEHSDEEHSDEEHSDEEQSDEEHSDEEQSDEEHSDEEQSDEAHSDEEQSDEAHSDEEQSDERQSDEEQSDEEQYAAILNRQDQLMKNAFPLRRFIETVKKLKQCQEILISDEPLLSGICCAGEDVRQFRQGPLTFHSKTSVEFVTRVLSVILDAVMQTEVSSVSTFDLNLWALSIDIGTSYSLIPCNSVRPDMLPYLHAPVTSIRHLFINLDCGFLEDLKYSKPGHDFGMFIKKFPNLSSFELYVVGEDWPSRLFGLFSSVTIPKLQKLTLGTLKCRKQELVDFLQRHETTLTEIDFMSIHLHDSQSWDDILRSIQRGPNNPRIDISDCEPEGGMIDDYQ